MQKSFGFFISQKGIFFSDRATLFSNLFLHIYGKPDFAEAKGEKFVWGRFSQNLSG